MAIFQKTEQGVKRTKETWFGRVSQLFDRDRVDEAVWDELEELLISADVGVSTSEKLIDRVKQRVSKERLDGPDQVKAALKDEMVDMLTPADGKPPLLAIEDRSIPAKPSIILVVGVNGVGKTTSIAKLAVAHQRKNKKVVLAAADTFRAAGIEQLQLWGDRIGADVISHQMGSDPGAVVFDAIKSAQGRQADVVIIDTAGRLHTKYNLMEELKKIKRVIAKTDDTAPHEVILVLDAITGQNGLSQAKHFLDAVGVSGIFLAKLDGTAKGGIVIAICQELCIPIHYIGTGEKVDDIALFQPCEFVEALFS